jgi:hypothetical protein
LKFEDANFEAELEDAVTRLKKKTDVAQKNAVDMQSIEE